MTAWTNPRTWAPGDLVTASELNTDVRDNPLFLRAAHYVALYLTSTTNIPNGATPNTAVSWDTELADTDGFHDNGTNPTRITVPTGLDGLYVCRYSLDFGSSAAGNARTSRFRQGGATARGNKHEPPIAGGVNTLVCHLRPLYLNAAQYIEVLGGQDSGAGINLGTGQDVTTFEMWLVGN